MANFKLKLESKVKKTGERNVIIAYKGVRFLTGVSCMENEFKADSGIVQKSVPLKAKNAKVQKIMSELLTLTIRFEQEHERQPDESEFTELCHMAKGDKPKCKRFIDYLDEFLETKKKYGTRKVYVATRRFLEEYDQKATFETMTPLWLTKFNDYLANKGYSINYRSIQLRNIRAVFNYSIDEEYTSRYPFRKFSIQSEKTEHRNLTALQWKFLRDVKIEPYQEKYRDVFLLSFYLIGMNPCDIFALTKDNVVNGRIEYTRRKTGRKYSIKVEPEAAEILERYMGKSDKLLSLAEQWTNYESFLQHLRTQLQKVVRLHGKVMTLHGNISIYWARHTWASLAYEIGIPRDVIGQSLGHSEWDSTTTDIYISKNTDKIDEANRKLLDYLK